MFSNATLKAYHTLQPLRIQEYVTIIKLTLMKIVKITCKTTDRFLVVKVNVKFTSNQNQLK